MTTNDLGLRRLLLLSDLQKLGGPGSGPHPGGKTHHDVAIAHGFVKVENAAGATTGTATYQHPGGAKLFVHANKEWTHQPLHGQNSYGKTIPKLESTLGANHRKV